MKETLRVEMTSDRHKNKAEMGIPGFICHETTSNPGNACNLLFSISEQLCKNESLDLDKIMTVLESLKDGEKISKIAGKTPDECKPYAEMLFDVFMVPIILNQLKEDGCFIAQGASIEDAPEEVQNKAKLNSYWDAIGNRKAEIEGLHQFQMATDYKSPYGRLILALAELALLEINNRD